MSKETETRRTASNSKSGADPDLFDMPARALKGDMNKYGIKCIAVPYYLYSGYRYTRLEDAVEQAKRDATKVAHS